MTSDLARPHLPSEYLMIHDIEIRNYKCFEHLRLADCKRINIVVGDNGAGKTALLEATFFALGGNAQIAVRNRQTRGFDGAVSGSTRQVEDALWGDLFYNFNTRLPISIILSGSGPEARSVFINRGPAQTLIPLSDSSSPGSSGSYNFVWKDHTGQEYDGSPMFKGTQLSFPPEREHLPDFFFFSSTSIGGAAENAARFSELSKARQHRRFVELFVKEYPWIEDLSIEVLAGQPVIHATLKDMQEKVPLNSISSGINRILSILLVMASHSRSVVLVDEIENGLYHKHHESFWRWLISFSKASESQLFLSTHSAEWLRSLTTAVDDETMNDFAFWRIERDESGKPELFRFDGITLKSGIEFGAEVRG
ncbi:ABC-type transport system involved in cytochrome c biogenesis ATPase subunit [Bradyrhizobium sp. AZCC 2262]|uniref:AAA family ATPase n=1 Tax=Bradyrhizobium sp. AZCC 2262 TaxID=3117022 RepID=UPI002FEFBBBE